MALIADGLMIVAGFTAGLYCLVLSRRLRRLSDSGQGIGAHIRKLSDAIADTRTAVAEARSGTEEAGVRLGREMRKAEGLIAELRRAAREAEAMRAAAVQAKPPPPEQDFLSPVPPAANAGPPPTTRFETVFDDMSDLDNHSPEISSVADAVGADLAGTVVPEVDPGGAEAGMASPERPVATTTADAETGHGEAGSESAVGADDRAAAAPVPARGVLHVERVAL